MDKAINKKAAIWWGASFATLYTAWHIVHSLIVVKATTLFKVMETAEQKAEVTRWYSLMVSMDKFNAFHMQAHKGVIVIAIIAILVLFIRFGIKATTLTIGTCAAASFICVYLIDKITQSTTGLLYYYRSIINAEAMLGTSFCAAFLIYLLLWLIFRQEKMETLRHTIR